MGNTLKLFNKYDLRKYSFNNRVINIWNSLPDYVVNIHSVNSFKRGLILVAPRAIITVLDPSA